MLYQVVLTILEMINGNNTKKAKLIRNIYVLYLLEDRSIFGLSFSPFCYTFHRVLVKFKIGRAASKLGQVFLKCIMGSNNTSTSFWTVIKFGQ